MTRQERFLEIMPQEISDRTYSYLVKAGFFQKPASLKYHGTETGGLFEHSTAVMNFLLAQRLKWSRPESPYIVGMFHDLCKTDDYCDANAKDIVIMGTGDPISTNPVWVRNDKPILTGHGDKSIMLLSQLMTLTEEEILCIRFHMGAYNTADWDGFDKAIRKYETVLWTHMADMYASKVVGI